MSRKERVDFMYSLANASWYDPFRKAWTRFVCQQAEDDLTAILKNIATEKTIILDLGCGTGFNIARINDNHIPYKHYIGLDGNPHMLSKAKNKFSHLRNITLYEQDITKLTNNKADIILCTWVMSHIEDPVGVINQWQSALNPGGTMLCIFLSQPKWYIDLWFRPLAIATQCNYIDAEQIKQINNLNHMQQYSQSLVTFISIQKD